MARAKILGLKPDNLVQLRPYHRCGCSYVRIVDVREQRCNIVFCGVHGIMQKPLQFWEKPSMHWAFGRGATAVARKVGLTPAARLKWLIDDFTAYLNYSARRA